MFQIVNNIIDRCFFTVTFILGVQLPEFLVQYKQRLSGHVSEAKLHLTQFQAIADQHYQGDLNAMIIKYQSNTELSIVNTAEVIKQLVTRVEYLQQQLYAISNNSYIEQIFNLVIHADKVIIRDTLTDFSLAIPLEMNALTTGAIIAVMALLIKELFLTISSFLGKKRGPEPSKN